MLKHPPWPFPWQRRGHIDTLAPHVWGKAAWEEFSKQSKSQSAGNCVLRWMKSQTARAACKGGIGWAIDQTSSGLVLVSRPKELPFLEHDMRPSEVLDLLSQPPEPDPSPNPLPPSPNPLLP